MIYQKILLPVDFSEFSAMAMTYAIHLALQNEAEIVVLHITEALDETMYKDGNKPTFEQALQKQNTYIDQQMQYYINHIHHHGVKFHTDVQRGKSVAQEIIRYVEQHDIDFVVMGTHGQTGFVEFVLGSTTQKVVRLSPVPVLSVRRRLEKLKVENILVPVDFSDFSAKAKDYALSIAGILGAEITFLHVLDRRVPPYHLDKEIEPEVAVSAEQEDHLIERLKAFVGTEEERWDYAWRSGRAHLEIVDFAVDRQVDLLIMSTHGLTGVERLLLGSTTERVVALSPCPVLTIKRQG